MKNRILISVFAVALVSAFFATSCNSPNLTDIVLPTKTATPTQTEFVTPTVTSSAEDTATATPVNTATDTATETVTQTVTETFTVTQTDTVTATPTSTITPIGTPYISAYIRAFSNLSSVGRVLVAVNGTPEPNATVVLERTDAPVATYTIPYSGPFGADKSEYYGYLPDLEPETNYDVHVTIGNMTFSGSGRTPSMPRISTDGLEVTFGTINPRLDVVIYDTVGGLAMYSSMNMNPVSPFAISSSIYTLPGYYTSVISMIDMNPIGASVFPGTNASGGITMESTEMSGVTK